MLLCLRSRLLAGDFTTNLKLLQHYPAVDFNHLLKVADDLKNWFIESILVRGVKVHFWYIRLTISNDSYEGAAGNDEIHILRNAGCNSSLKIWFDGSFFSVRAFANGSATAQEIRTQWYVLLRQVGCCASLFHLSASVSLTWAESPMSTFKVSRSNTGSGLAHGFLQLVHFYWATWGRVAPLSSTV